MANGVVTKGAAKTMQKPGKPESKRDNWIVRAKRFLRESYIEVRYKAAWPSKVELRKFTTVVIMAVLMVGAYIALLDWVLTQITAAMGFGFHK